MAELMTPSNYYYGFRNLSKMRGLAYFTANGLTEADWAKEKAKQDGRPYAETAEQDAQPREEHQDWREKFLSMTAPGYRKRHRQNDKWLYFTEEMFTSLVGAAINAQRNRGFTSANVKPAV